MTSNVVKLTTELNVPQFSAATELNSSHISGR